MRVGFHICKASICGETFEKKRSQEDSTDIYQSCRGFVAIKSIVKFEDNKRKLYDTYNNFNPLNRGVVHRWKKLFKTYPNDLLSSRGDL